MVYWSKLLTIKGKRQINLTLVLSWYLYNNKLRYSSESRYENNVKVHGFFSFAKNVGQNISNYVSKNW